MIKEYKESDLDHREKEEMPLIARQAIALSIILIVIVAILVLR